MTNLEAYGMTQGLAAAFRESGFGISATCFVSFSHHEYDKPILPCPACHRDTKVLPYVKEDGKVVYHVVCASEYCRYCSPIGETEEKAIANHNAFCKKIINTREGAQ